MAIFDEIDEAEAHEAQAESRSLAFLHENDTDENPLATLAATASQLSPYSSSLYRQPEPQTPRTSHTASESVLGRRPRNASDAMLEWSPTTKQKLSAFAKVSCDEHGIQSDEKESIVAASQLSSQKLLIVMMVRQVRDEQEGARQAMVTYLSSSIFKENVANRLQSTLLDPKLFSYKTGLLERCMRHIRLNPGAYLIPRELRSIISTNTFASVVSKALVDGRNQLKQKMWKCWQAKRDIYSTTKLLAFRGGQEMTPAIWGRWAWVQLKLIDYADEVKEGKQEKTKFWDFIDKELAERRAKYAALPSDQRIEKTSRIFELALIHHQNACPPVHVGVRKGTSERQLPSWQRDIASAVREMEGYTEEELYPESGDEPEKAADDEEQNTGAEQQGSPGPHSSRGNSVEV